MYSYSSKNKLSEQDIERAYASLQEGKTLAELARDYVVSTESLKSRLVKRYGKEGYSAAIQASAAYRKDNGIKLDRGARL